MGKLLAYISHFEKVLLLFHSNVMSEANKEHKSVWSAEATKERRKTRSWTRSQVYKTPFILPSTEKMNTTKYTHSYLSVF